MTEEEQSFDLGDVSNNDTEVTNDVSSQPTAFGDMGEERDVYRDDGTLRSDSQRSDSTDQVDIRKLVKEPSLSDIRWVYRNTFAKVLVDKPVDDSFKNGYKLENDPADKVADILDEWESAYQLGKKKSRRDGMSVLFHVYEDSDEGPHVPPTRDSFTDYLGTNVLTVDDLADIGETEIEDQVPDGYGSVLEDGVDPHEVDHRTHNYECRESGLVLSKKVNDVNWNDPIGVVLDQWRVEDGTMDHSKQFAHIDRLQILTCNKEVDGDFSRDNNQRYGELRQDSTTIGKWEGDSELQPVYHLIKDVFKGNWALMQTVFRYASPFYEVSVPARDAQDEEQFQAARNMFNNLNAKSEGIFPEDYEVEMHDSEGSFDPQGYFDPIFDQICAGTEMTKSVLFGTQAGTVSGTEGDQKSYYNTVNRLQNTVIEDDMDEFVRQIGMLSSSLVPNFALGYEVNWNPIFELGELEKAENARTVLNAVSQISNQYALTPNEVRSLTREVLEELDYQTDLSEDLEIEDFDLIADLNLAANGNNVPMPVEVAQQMASQSSEGGEEGSEEQGNPLVGQNMDPGQSPNEGTSNPSQPQRDSE